MVVITQPKMKKPRALKQSVRVMVNFTPENGKKVKSQARKEKKETATFIHDHIIHIL